MSHHYDVVCLGMTPGILAAAALLARRTFRVLVVGEGHRRARYAYDEIPLLRRQRPPVGYDTPVFARIRLELAEEATWRRKARLLDPMFQLQWEGGKSLAVPPSLERFLGEVERVAPGERAAVAAFYPELAEYNACMDALLPSPSHLFGHGLFARRRHARALRELATLHAQVPNGPRAPIGPALQELVRFAAPVVNLPPLAAARLHGSWTRGITRLEGGDDALVDLLVERIRASGGSVEAGARVTALGTRGKRVNTVALDDARPPVQAGFVLTVAPARAFFRKLPHFSPDARDLAGLFLPRAVQVRTSTSFALPSGSIPAEWAEECIMHRAGELPIRVHVERGSAPDAPGLLAVSADFAPAEVPEGRERVARALFAAAPELERAIWLVDSVHDGAPLWDLRSGQRVLVPRGELRDPGATREEAEPLYELDDDDPFAGERLDAILPNVYVVGPTAMPALGLEGEFASALHAGYMVTKSDRTREKMRKELWSKLEADS